MQGVWWKPFENIAHSAASNRSSLELHVFFLHWFNYSSIWSSVKNRMQELQLSNLKVNNSVSDYKMLHTETMNINVLQFQHSESFLLAGFCPAEQWNRCSVSPGSFHNRQDEIVSLVRQLTLEVCSKHILFCTSIPQLPIREATQAARVSRGENEMFFVSRQKTPCWIKVGFGMSKFLCFYSCGRIHIHVHNWLLS